MRDDPYDSAPFDSAPLTASVVAIGNFDGVHRGHRVVLDALFAASKRLSAPSCVYTFDPAPTAVVAPERHQPRIQTLPGRIRSLREAGVDHVVVERFTLEFSRYSAKRFVDQVLLARLGARALVVGHDFRFGSMRAGDAGAIRRLAPEMEVIEVAAFVEGEDAISSSRVRKLIARGEVEAAAALLGRPVTVSGRIVHGDARGRTLGFPTANVSVDEELRPGNGVYAVRVRLADERVVDGVANFGTRPTLDAARYAAEVHLLDFDEDLYGQRLEVALLGRLREERRFGSVEALAAQIGLDVAAARALLR